MNREKITSFLGRISGASAMMKVLTQSARWMARRGWFLLGSICETAPVLVVVSIVLYLHGGRLGSSTSWLERIVGLLESTYLVLLYVLALLSSRSRLKGEAGE